MHARTALMHSVLAMPLLAACTSGGPEQSPPLVGAWRSSIHFSSGAFATIKDLEFMYVFNAGGTMTESSNYDSAPPVPPAYGSWRQTGPQTFQARYEYYATSPAKPGEFAEGAGWFPAGRGVFVETIRMSPDGNTFESTLRYEAFDAQGKPIAGGGDAKGSGKKIPF